MPISVAILAFLALAANGDSHTVESQEITLQGLIVHVDEGEEQIPSIDAVDLLPSGDKLNVIAGVTVTFSNSDSDSAVANTGDDGRFTVRLPHLGQQETAALRIERTGFRGMYLGRLRLGEGSLPLKAGENLLLIELPPAPCLPPKKEGTED